VAKRILKVLVDESACASHEACNHVPEVFAFTGHYHPVVPADAAEHFEAKRDAIIEAVLACPVAALSLEFEDGRVITSDDFEHAGGVRRWQEY
jgi:ferredoxin